MYKQHKPPKKKKTPLIIGVSLLVLLMLAAGYLYWKNQNNNGTENTTTTQDEPVSKQDRPQSQDAKDRIVDEQNNQGSDSTNGSDSEDNTGKKQVNVVITHADQNSVNAYVNGILEEGGTCTATFTQNNTTIQRTSEGFANVSYTQCAPITPDLPNSNTWSVVLTYESAEAQGTSESQSF